MSYLDKLLEGVEVEWKTLGEVANYEQPTKYLVNSTNYKDCYATPVLTAGQTFILGYTDEINGIYKASLFPVIIFDDFTTANKWVDFDFKAKSSAMKLITSKDEAKVLLKYIFYYLNTLQSGLVNGDHKRQWISNYANKIIPIPCPDNPKKSLEIQTEIVRILDKFSTLTAELQARKSQYGFYRDKLLTFDSEEEETSSLHSDASSSSLLEQSLPKKQKPQGDPRVSTTIRKPHNKVKWMKLGENMYYNQRWKFSKERFYDKRRWLYSLWTDLYVLWM